MKLRRFPTWALPKRLHFYVGEWLPNWLNVSRLQLVSAREDKIPFRAAAPALECFAFP